MSKLPRAGRPSTAKERAIEAVQQIDTPVENAKSVEILSPVSNQALTVNISLSDQEELQKLEHIIDENLAAFYEVGKALKTIHDKKLYKLLGYSRFEDYCVERWDLHQGHARRLEAASSVVDNLKSDPNGINFLPTHERQIRPMTILTPEQQVKVWGRVLEDAPIILEKPKITTRLVESKVQEVLGQFEALAAPSIKKPVKNAIQLSEYTDDFLNESLYKLRKNLGNHANKEKISRELIVEAALQVALEHLQNGQVDNPLLTKVLQLLTKDETP